ncbi:phosphonatase-like hydrolase [Actinocorallia sp. A-T 12471]|uniref:phosphonatase-like hydrolase n=1 Tax=Actinocorallia sp. A-T 12471 TaxID=3089813 RepID=UPI0029D167C5|nr:phosphonatase-like hydrolase [Actinocorallia sp. A-T 12471]MDX6741409.1 phosphonatase-like hydrolase [Actinocorallia sp. A-T 12471]
MIELVACDVAGTTVQEHGAVYVALREAVEAAGATPSDADIDRAMGADKREAIYALLGGPSPGTVEDVFADFHARLTAAYAARRPEPLPGVEKAFTVLREAGIKVALTTGFDRSITDAILDRLGWDSSVVDAVVCADDVAAGRPAPYMIFRAMELTGVRAVSSVLTAGDTVLDLRAGSNAGAAYVVGVLTGAMNAGQLGVERHTHLLPGVADVPALLGLGG